MSLTQALQIPFAPSRYGQGQGVLLPDLVNSNAASGLGLTVDDDFIINLFPRILPTTLGGATATQQLSSGSAIVFSIKSVAGISGSTLLAEATSFSEYQDGNDNWYYGGMVNLQTSNLSAAMGSNRTLAAIAEIRITDGTGATMRYQFNVTFYQAVFTGTEPTPTAPAPGQVLAFTAGGQAISSGVDTVTVSGLALGATPAFVIPMVVKANGGEANIEAVLRAGWTADGFTVDLDTLTPDDTYILTWIIVSSSGSVGSQTVANGVNSVMVDLTLVSSPTLILPVLVKQTGATNIRAFLRAGWSGAGFTVDLDATTPDATYVLYYLLIP